MSKIELLAKIELLNKYEAMIEELKAEADTVRNSIKAEMDAREVEELIAGQYIVRWTSVLSNRFDSTSFKKVMPEVYKAYTKQVSSRRFSISV
jgi:predicted phage-related endonuclease